MRFKSLKKGFKRSFIKSLRLAPHVFILFSIFISNIVYPAFAIAQDFDILVGEESTNETIPIDESEDILDEGISTSVFENGIYTIDKVVEGEEYVYPENENLRVKFNKVTEDGNLVIKRVLLTEEQKTSLNTKDDYGWDISSTMNNGTFSYNLTLPNTQGNDIQVKYTEDGSNYESIENSTVDNSKVVIEGLDHFTMFVVTNPLPSGVSNGDACTVASINGTCYSTIQAAINAANSGDTINVSPGEYDETLLIGESKNNITIAAIRDTNPVVIRPATAVPSTNRIVDIRGSNIKFTYFLIDGNSKSYVGISISGQGNVIESNIIENVLTGIQTTTANTNGNNRIASNTVRSATVALSLQNDKNWIEKNAFSNISSEGMGVLNAKNSTIIENKFYINTTGVNLRDYSSTPSSYVNFSDIINKNVFSNLVYITDNSGNILGNTLYTKISDAINAASGGNIINVGNGTYTEDLNITKSITLKSITGYENTTIKGFIHISSNDVTVDGFTIDNNNQTDGRAIALGSSTGTTITNNKIVNAYRGIQGDYYGRPKNLTITNNIFENISYGIASTEDITNLLVTGNTFKTSQEGIGLGVGVEFPTGKTIDNLLTDNTFNITGGYAIGDYRSGTLVVYQALLAQITSVTTNKGYYKKGDTLTIKVTVKNTGTVPFNTNTEKLAVNLMSPSNTYVSGTFAEYRSFSLDAGKSTDLTFYTNPQTIPSTWAEGTYNVHTSIYSSRVPKGYLDGGQYRGTPFVIDNQKPTIEILSPDENSVHKGTLNIQVNGTDTKGLGQFVVNLYRTGETPVIKPCVNQNMAGALEGTVTCTINTKEYMDGSYYIKTNVKDLAGNMSSTLQRTFIFDNNGPLAPIIEFPTEDSYFNSTPILNNWSDVEDISDIAYYRIEYVYDDGHHFSEEPYRITTESQRYHVPADNEQGGVKFRVQAIDNAGNEGAWSDYRHYYFDKTSPEAPSLSSPSNGAIVNGSILTNKWSSVLGAVKYIYASYNDENATSLRFTDTYTTTSKSASNVPNADIWWKVKSVDAAGNESGWSELWKVTIDNDAPTITVNDLTTNDTTPQITGTYSDPHISTITLKVNGKDYSSIIDITTSTWSVDITDKLLDGTYTLEATAVDMAGNTSSSAGALVIDTTGPSKVLGLHIISNTGTDLRCEGYTNNRNIEIDWNDNTETDLDHYILDIKDKDGHKDNIINSFYDAQIRDTDGYYKYKIRAVDELGNIGQASDWCGVTLDRVDPIVPVISNITLNEGDTIPEIKGTITDTYSIKFLNYSITGQLTTSGTLTPLIETNSWEINISQMIKDTLGTTVVDTSLIPEGTYTFTYSATDSAGNTSEEKSFSIVVNNVAPSITSLVLSSSSINEGNTLTVIPTFTDSSYPSKYTPDDSPWTYSISYGDGITTYGTQDTPGTFTLTHTYTHNGTYPITLTICEATDESNINSENQCDTSTQSIEVLNDSPVLSLTPLLTTVTQNSAPVVISSSITGGNAPYAYTWTGCIDNGNQTATVNTVTLGTNTCTLTITDYDGDAVTANAVVVVEAPAVLGAATRTVTTTTYETLGIGGPEEDTVLSEDNTTNPEVKGVNECQDKKTISGYVYMDSNNNGEKENNEKLLKDIEIRIYTKTDNSEETIEKVKTDEEGYWETKVCEGEYFIEINTESLPNNTSLDSNVKSVSITADTTESTIDFGITDTRNFIQKYWPWLLLGVVSVGLISFLFVTNRNKKEL